MPSRTPSISHIFLFIAGMFSIHSAHAAAPRDLEACKQAYFTAFVVPVAQRETPTVQSQLKSWCAAQCVDEKIDTYAAQQNQQVTEALRTQLTPTYQPACTAQYSGASSSNVATTPATSAGTGTVSNTPSECVWNLSAGQQPTPAQQNACQQAMQRQYDEQRRAELARQQQPTTSGQQPSTGQQQRAAIIPPLINAATRGLAGSGTSAGTAGSGTTGGNATTPATPSYALPQLDLSATPREGSAPAAPIPAPQNAGAATDTAVEQMNPSDLEKPLQWPAKQATDQVETDRSGKTVVPRSAISQSAQQNAQMLASDANNLIEQLRKLLCTPIDGKPDGVYKKTLTAFEKRIGNAAATEQTVCVSVSSYTNPTSFGLGNTVPADNVPVTAGTDAGEAAANSGSSTAGTGSQGGQQGADNPLTAYNRGRAVECAGAAERAEKLCVESDSMKALKNVMDAAGPVLMGLNAAARTCGGMNNVSKFVGAGLTAANAICIAKKMKCEKTCSQLAADFSNKMKELENEFADKTGGVAGQDKDYIDEKVCLTHKNLAQQYRANANEAAAKAEDALFTSCTKANEEIYKMLPQAVGRISSLRQRESNMSMPGTAIAMDAKCKAKTRNIVGLATNIGAIALAASNARKCEKELAAPGAADGGIANINSADYCSNEATSGSQFCKCQSSPSTEGCGQVLAAGPPSSNTPTDQRGVNLQNGRGPSGFAGAGDGSGSGSSSGYRGYGLGEDGSSTGQSNLGSISSTMGSGSGPAMGLAGGAAGGNGSGSVSSSDAKAAAKKEDDKSKWSFGSIASSIGGSLGFGGGSRGGDNSNFKDDQRERIERKLASDRLAAEISPSTGADNFSKVKRSYVQKADTFMAP